MLDSSSRERAYSLTIMVASKFLNRDHVAQSYRTEFVRRDMVRSKDAGKRVPAANRVESPQEGTAERRRAILRAAMEVFAVRGFRGASLVEIAEAVGMTHSGVIHHFGNKEQLLLAVLEFRDTSDVARLKDHQAPTGAALLEHLIVTAEQNTKRAGIVQGYAVLSAESVTEGHPAQEYFRDRFRGLRAMLVDALRIVTDDELPPARLDAAASGIIGAMDGLQVQWLLEPAAVDMPTSLRAIIDGTLQQLETQRALDRPSSPAANGKVSD